jgi:hypothetical protein
MFKPYNGFNNDDLVWFLSKLVLGSGTAAVSLGFLARGLLFGNWLRGKVSAPQAYLSTREVLGNVFFAVCAIFAALIVFACWNGYQKAHFAEHFHEDWFAQNMPLCLKNRGGSIWLQRTEC